MKKPNIESYQIKRSLNYSLDSKSSSVDLTFHYKAMNGSKTQERLSSSH